MSKKIKLSDQHAPNCDDPSCRGCDVGEIEVTFTSEDGKEKITLTPIELFQVALEESSKEEHDFGVVKRLFDLALEGFESLLSKEKEKVREESVKERDKRKREVEEKWENKGKKREFEEDTTTTSSEQTRYQYALCCIAFGSYLPLIEQIKKGVDILKGIVTEDANFYKGWIGLGRGLFTLVRSLK